MHILHTPKGRECHHLTPAGNSAPNGHSLTLPWWNEEKMGWGENGKGTSKRTCAWDKDSLLGKTKTTCTKQSKEFIHDSHGQASVLPESWAPPWTAVTWDVKCHLSKCSTLSPFSPRFYRLSQFLPLSNMLRYEQGKIFN